MFILNVQRAIRRFLRTTWLLSLASLRLRSSLLSLPSIKLKRGPLESSSELVASFELSKISLLLLLVIALALLKGDYDFFAEERFLLSDFAGLGLSTGLLISSSDSGSSFRKMALVV
jgi:hypothetical protein